MLGVVLHIPEAETALQQWEYALSHFCPDQVFCVGAEIPQSYALRSAQLIKTAADLPQSLELVVMAPLSGAHVQGTRNLAYFEHPADAVYWFGSDSHHLDPTLFHKRQADHLVYIPTDTKDQMYSHTAWAVTAWDRGQKERAYGYSR